MSTSGSKSNEHVAHFLVDIHKHRPPEKQSVLKHLREIQERNKQKPTQKQRKKSIDRDSR